jgi:hypothetical protein
MPGTELQPSLTVYRQLSGIDRKQMRLLRARLREAGPVSPDLARNTMSKPHKLRASLLMRQELRNFYDSQGLTVTRTQVGELGRFIQHGLEQFIDPRKEIPLLPAALYPLGSESSKKFLMVARDDTALLQRAVTKNAVRAFFEVAPEKVSEDVWFDDEFVTGVLLAHCRGPAQLEAVTVLGELLKTEGPALAEEGIIPTDVRLGRAAVQYFLSPCVA